jgi:hypothetical protein
MIRGIELGIPVVDGGGISPVGVGCMIMLDPGTKDVALSVPVGSIVSGGGGVE